MRVARNSQKGVTLVETLVALAVMGLIIGALLVLMGQNSRFAATMRERAMASIAADNLMVEALVLRDAIEIGETEGEVAVGGETYLYRRAIIETGVANIVRVEIDVMSPNGDQRLGHAVSMRRAS